MAKLEIALLAGEESKRFLVELTTQLDRFETLLQALKESSIEVTPTLPPEEEESDDDDFEPKPTPKAPAKKKAPAESFDEDEDELEEAEEVEAVEEEEDDEDADFTAPPPKAKKGKAAKKLTADDCNDAAKAKAKSIGGKEGRQAVLDVLKKKFKTDSVTALKPDQYEAFIAAMAVEE